MRPSPSFGKSVHDPQIHKPQDKVSATGKIAGTATARQKPDAVEHARRRGRPGARLADRTGLATGITFNLQLLFKHATLVDEFPLPDDTEPAPVFRA